MRYIEKSFDTFAVGTEEYRDNWDRIFGKKDAEPESAGSCEPPSPIKAPRHYTDRKVNEQLEMEHVAREILVEAAARDGEYSEPLTPEERTVVPFYEWRKKLAEQLHAAIPDEIQKDYNHPLRAVWFRLNSESPWDKENDYGNYWFPKAK